MKKFEDLEFKPHTNGIGGKQAVIDFKNGFGVSVIFGNRFYSNGIDTYELAVLDGVGITYNTHITDDVIGYISKEEVTNVMKQVQELKG